MKILVVYYKEVSRDRATIEQHLFSFQKYSSESYFYLNTFFGVPPFATQMSFDVVIYHYSFTALKFWGPDAFLKKLARLQELKRISGYKIAIPQDEYLHSDIICQFFKEFGVQAVLTCLKPPDYEKVYPGEQSGLREYQTVLTGYVDTDVLEKIQREGLARPHRERKTDVIYRARRVPASLGRQGVWKHLLTEVFREAAAGSGLKCDLSNAERKVKYGGGWYSFLGSSRVVLGCEGGASLLDAKGEIRDKVAAFARTHPTASFDEMERACFPGLDGNLSLFALSPRQFDAAMTVTCQALIEGEYNGILIPDRHYIAIRKDWSNLAEVIEKIRDIDYCESMAKRTYQEIVLNPQYSYKKLVDQVLLLARKNLTMEVQCDRAYYRYFFFLWPYLFPLKWIRFWFLNSFKQWLYGILIHFRVVRTGGHQA